MKVFYQPTYTNVFILSSPFLRDLEHVEVDSLSGSSIDKGDIIIGFEYTNEDYPEAYIVGYHYITGVGYTNNREEDMVRFIFRNQPWIIEPIINHSVALESLFNAYSIYAYKYVKSSMEETIVANRDIVYSYALRLKDYKRMVDELPIIKSRFRVIRNSKYVRNLNTEELTYIVICNGKNGAYLKVIGKYQQDVTDKLPLKFNVLNHISYVFLPDDIQDVSIDFISSIISK